MDVAPEVTHQSTSTSGNAYDRITALLTPARHGFGQRYECPACGGSSSLKVTPREGKADVKCFGGCAWQLIYASVGLPKSAMYDAESAQQDKAEVRRICERLRAAIESYPWGRYDTDRRLMMLAVEYAEQSGSLLVRLPCRPAAERIGTTYRTVSRARERLASKDRHDSPWLIPVVRGGSFEDGKQYELNARWSGGWSETPHVPTPTWGENLCVTSDHPLRTTQNDYLRTRSGNAGIMLGNSKVRVTMALGDSLAGVRELARSAGISHQSVLRALHGSATRSGLLRLGIAIEEDGRYRLGKDLDSIEVYEAKADDRARQHEEERQAFRLRLAAIRYEKDEQAVRDQYGMLKYERTGTGTRGALLPVPREMMRSRDRRLIEMHHGGLQTVISGRRHVAMISDDGEIDGCWTCAQKWNPDAGQST